MNCMTNIFLILINIYSFDLPINLTSEILSVVCRNTQSNDLFHAVIAMPLGAVLGNSTNGKALFHEKTRLPIGRPDQHDVGALFL